MEKQNKIIDTNGYENIDTPCINYYYYYCCYSTLLYTARQEKRKIETIMEEPSD